MLWFGIKIYIYFFFYFFTFYPINIIINIILFVFSLNLILFIDMIQLTELNQLLWISVNWELLMFCDINIYSIKETTLPHSYFKNDSTIKNSNLYLITSSIIIYNISWWKEHQIHLQLQIIFVYDFIQIIICLLNHSHYIIFWIDT